jgi:S-adenosylmethionine:tRNA ribosyltransferase-isomerase
MHEERFSIPEAAAATINEAKAAGGKLWAVGTTVTRTLESVADADGRIVSCDGVTALFIRPGYQFRAVDRLLTNFHLPRSTLLMLVAAFGGYEQVMEAYRVAVREGYRFYSYGDAMLLL